MKKLTQDEFVQKCREVHGDRYDYSLAVYAGNKTPVAIVCSVHGTFSQAPFTHFIGRGCPSCGHRVTAAKHSITLGEFTRRAQQIHGKTYDYSAFNLVKMSKPGRIMCPEHGEFLQSANNHLKGQGCPTCGLKYLGIARALDMEEFLSRSKSIHGDLYDYSQTTYKGTSTKLTIMCQEHGPFSTTPDCHFRGHGCPACARRGFNLLKPGWVYLVRLQSPTGDYLGYGITGNLLRRMKDHKINASRDGFHIEMVHSRRFCSGATASAVEDAILSGYATINTGVPGFRQEATHINNLPAILELVNQY